MSQREFLVSIPVFRIKDMNGFCSISNHVAHQHSEARKERQKDRYQELHGNRSKEAAGTPEFSDNGIMGR